jgi:RNA polymerase sigma-70 factor (ECF subfamily)
LKTPQFSFQVVSVVTDEKSLIAKAQQGDKAALEQLISRYWQPVFRLACLKTGNGEDAQEITQETFLKAFRALPGYRETNASFKTYLGRIALNLITDFWRKKGRSPQIVALADFQEPLADPAPLPEDSALSRERRESIGRLVAMLPAEQRRTVELRIFAALSLQETARLMGKTEAAVKMLQQRALRNLRRLFDEYGISG